jgi:hypothetical protein
MAAKKTGPGQIEFRPQRLGQVHLRLAQHGANQVLAEKLR